MHKEIEAEIARGKAKTAARHENALLACTPECEEIKKKRETERKAGIIRQEELARKRKEREKDSIQLGRKRRDGGQAKRTSRKWRETESESNESDYRRWFKVVLASAAVVLISIIVAVVIKSEWRGTVTIQATE